MVITHGQSVDVCPKKFLNLSPLCRYGTADVTLQWSVGQGYAQELIRLKFEDECLAVSIKVGIRKWNDFSCQKVRCSRTWEIAGTYTHIDIEDVSCVIEHSATLKFNDLKCQSSRHIVRSRFETYRHRNNRNCNYTF